MVLGIEVDNLFNCHLQDASGQPVSGEGPACTIDYVSQQMQKYYGMGVRHIFPIHNFDNAYGTPAAWQDPIDVGNRVSEGAGGMQSTAPIRAMGSIWIRPRMASCIFLALAEPNRPIYPTFTSGSCHNTPGLTSLGGYLIKQAMNMGMIIDVDHMSINAFNETIDLANQQTPSMRVSRPLTFNSSICTPRTTLERGAMAAMSACELARNCRRSRTRAE